MQKYFKVQSAISKHHESHYLHSPLDTFQTLTNGAIYSCKTKIDTGHVLFYFPNKCKRHTLRLGIRRKYKHWSQQIPQPEGGDDWQIILDGSNYYKKTFHTQSFAKINTRKKG